MLKAISFEPGELSPLGTYYGEDIDGKIEHLGNDTVVIRTLVNEYKMPESNARSIAMIARMGRGIWIDISEHIAIMREAHAKMDVATARLNHDVQQLIIAQKNV